MTSVLGVAMAVVHVVIMIAVAHRLVAAIGGMGVAVLTVLTMAGAGLGALVPVRLVRAMGMAIVKVVGMAAMADRGVAAARVMRVRMTLVARMAAA